MSSSQPPGRRRLWVYLMLFVMCTINYSDRAALSVGIASIATEFNLSPIWKGWLLSSYLWTYVIFLVPTAMIVDRWGTRRMAALSVAFWSAATMMTGLVWSLPSLIVSRLFLGLGEAPCFPLGHRTIREWAPAPERGFAATAFTSGILAGVAFGALASGWLITLFGWRMCFVIFGAAGFAWVALWWALFDEPTRVRWLGAAERTHIAQTRQLPEAGVNRKVSVWELLRQPAMWGLIITQICGNYTNIFFLTWLPSYLNTARHISILGSGVDTAICYGIACVGTVLAGAVSDRALRFAKPPGGRRYLVALLLLGCSMMAFAPYITSHTALLVLLTVSITCMQSSLANNQALLSDLLPDGQAIGTAIGLLFMFANVFAIGAPISTGFIVEHTGSYVAAFAFAASLTVLGAISVLVLARKPICLPPTPLIRPTPQSGPPGAMLKSL